jgi:hypothetical protein
MIIFLRNIPSDTKKYEIANFVNSALNNTLLYGHPVTVTNITTEDIDIIDILSVENVDSNVIESHGLVRIFPDNVGEIAIKKLDGATFKGKPITIRKYIIRSERNDPRSKHPADIKFKEQRTSDRRRGEKKNISILNRR